MDYDGGDDDNNVASTTVESVPEFGTPAWQQFYRRQHGIHLRALDQVRGKDRHIDHDWTTTYVHEDSASHRRAALRERRRKKQT